MRLRTPRLPPLILPSTVILAVTTVGVDAAAAAQESSETLAVQGLVVLAGFTIVLFVSLALLARTVSRLSAAPRIGVEELKRRLDQREDLLLLDVRTVADFAGEQGHIAGAINVPLEALESRLGELAANPRQPIALVCRTDRRSDQAAALLIRRGFADVGVVRGGMTAWLGHGWPVEGAHPKTG